MYDPKKVDFSQKEHDAAKAADQLFELAKDRLKDGVDVGDLFALGAAIGPSRELYVYLFGGGSRTVLAHRLIALGTMLERDNLPLPPAA